MIGIRHEEYARMESSASYILYKNLKRSKNFYSSEANWHENLEIQFCLEGEGTAILDGISYSIKKGDIIAINSNSIHYTGTRTFLSYSALIFSSSFCRQMKINYDRLVFRPVIQSRKIFDLYLRLEEICERDDDEVKAVKENAVLLGILIELTENFSVKDSSVGTDSNIKLAKETIEFIRENYTDRITLESISRKLYCNKFKLSREFKKYTGETIVEYINNYRCHKAARLILSGCSVTQAAQSSGFNNLSFFTRTFKQYMGVLPSRINQKEKVKNMRM